MSEARTQYIIRRKAEKIRNYREAWVLYTEKYKDSLDFPYSSDEQYEELMNLMELRRKEALQKYASKEDE